MRKIYIYTVQKERFILLLEETDRNQQVEVTGRFVFIQRKILP